MRRPDDGRPLALGHLADIQIQSPHVTVAHEAVVGKISDEQLFYLQSRGLSEEEAAAMIVNGFIEPVTKELPMEVRRRAEPTDSARDGRLDRVARLQ